MHICQECGYAWERGSVWRSSISVFRYCPACNAEVPVKPNPSKGKHYKAFFTTVQDIMDNYTDEEMAFGMVRDAYLKTIDKLEE